METPNRGTCPCYALFVDPWHHIVFHSLQSLPVMLPLVTPPEGCSSILSIAQGSGLQTFAPKTGMRKMRGRKTLVAQSHVVPTWIKPWREQNRRARETGRGDSLDFIKGIHRALFSMFPTPSFTFGREACRLPVYGNASHEPACYISDFVGVVLCSLAHW